MSNLILQTDSYKFSQFLQYPPNTAYISSYIESRGGEDESVFFGLQAFIKQYLLKPITNNDIDEAERIVTAHGLPFNREGWEIIVKEYGGYLPLTIEAVPEGLVMPTSNIQVQVINNDLRLFWLTSYIETILLRAIWYPSTVATKSRKMKKIIAKALNQTSDIPVDDQIQFKLHDFGARGVSSEDSAILGGMAHLVNFMGTDTAEALVGAMKYYNTNQMPGYSIPASEHSTITSWQKDNEVVAYDNMINKFAGDGKIYACVSDSYDIFKATAELWGTELKQKIIESGGTLVIRPDSGDPTIVPVQILQILEEKFGVTINSKGYKVLPSYIRVIQGDGINENSLPILIDNVKKAGFSLENIAFGMGGGLLQAWNRDTLKYAMKASAICDSEGRWKDVYKDPITDHGKVSKKGQLGLIQQNGIGTVSYRTTDKKFADIIGNVLRPVYRNGELLIEDTFENIRERAALKESEYNDFGFERY